MAQARGAVLALAGMVGLPVVSYTAPTVKKSVTGHGRADKERVAGGHYRPMLEGGDGVMERLQTLIGPTMTVVLGALLFWVIFSVLGPIYDLISQLEF